MNLEELKDRLTSALHPILSEAEAKTGLIVGGMINICEPAFRCLRCNARQLPLSSLSRKVSDDGQDFKTYIAGSALHPACDFGPCEPDSPAYVRRARITIARQGSECVTIEHVERVVFVNPAAPVPIAGTWSETGATPIAGLTNLTGDMVGGIEHRALASNEPINAVDVMRASEKWTGNTCPACGSPRVVRHGPCEKCLACGENVGGCG